MWCLCVCGVGYVISHVHTLYPCSSEAGPHRHVQQKGGGEREKEAVS